MNNMNWLRNEPPIFIRTFGKVRRVLDCWIFKSDLFHSDMVDGKTNT